MPPFFLEAARFTMYFPGKSPFPWRSQALIMQFPQVAPMLQSIPSTVLGEGSAENEGDYKYGVQVSHPNEDEPIYDDDPRLIIY
jgi:hypothetical protein